MRLVNDDIWAVLTILQEAEGEPYQGMLAVAEVIRNRMEKHINSDGTIVGTIFRAFQFSGWNTDSLRRVATATADSNKPAVNAAMTAWHEALLGNSNVTQGATHYFNPKLAKPIWAAQYIKTVSIGQHDFYRPKDAAGH